MPIKLKSVTDFAREVGTKKKAQEILSRYNIRIIDGFFDEKRLEAAFNEPQWLRNRRKNWGLSHSSGLGAVKYLLDPLKINIVEHECRGSQWLMLQGPSGKRNYVKMYYTGKLRGRGTTAQFDIRNFLHETAPCHFLCVSFDGPHIWVISTRELSKAWRELSLSGTFGAHTPICIPEEGANHAFGFIRVTFNVDKGKHVLDSPSKLGIS